MKLYEFVVTDQHDMDALVLDYYARVSLEETAVLLGWAPEYIIVSHPSVNLSDGTREIVYEVFGEYLEEEQ